jgi:hypothetical protein
LCGIGRQDAEFATCVFYTTDPSGVWGGLNLYLYASADPVNRADAFGLKDYRYSAGTSSVLPSEMEIVPMRLENENPIAPGWNTAGPLARLGAAYVASGAEDAAFYFALFGFPDAANLLWHYLGNTGDTAKINFERLKAEAPRSFERAADLEFDAVLKLIEQTEPSEGRHYIYSSDASKRVRGTDTPYPFILEEGVPTTAKESPNWFLAVNDFAMWGEGTLIASCNDPGMIYEVQLNIHFFDLYDWERNPGEPPGVGANFGPIKVQDSDLRNLYLAGLAKYFYVRERAPVSITRKYISAGGELRPLDTIGPGR